MSTYQIIKNNQKIKWNKKEITNDGYVMKLHLKEHENFIEVNEITIMDETLKNHVLNKQFQIAFRKLFKQVLEVIEDDGSSEGDYVQALNQIEKMKRVLKDKYLHEVSQEEYRFMYHKANLLEKELHDKITLQKNIRKQLEMMMQQEMVEEEKGRGR